ncbi:MAG TPA: hypothetical protein VIU11_23310 [Nakamurella sp.]
MIAGLVLFVGIIATAYVAFERDNGQPVMMFIGFLLAACAVMVQAVVLWALVTVATVVTGYIAEKVTRAWMDSRSAFGPGGCSHLPPPSTSRQCGLVALVGWLTERRTPAWCEHLDTCTPSRWFARRWPVRFQRPRRVRPRPGCFGRAEVRRSAPGRMDGRR